MKATVRRALASFGRDRNSGLGARGLAQKAVRYGLGLALAPFYLRGVSVVEEGVRTLGCPRIDNQGYMTLGHGTVLRSLGVAVELATGPDGELRIGRGVSINYGVSIGCLVRVDVGDRCRLGPYVMIVDSEFHDLYDRSLKPAGRPVSLAEDVWVGAKASILPGVSIGRGAVVGVGAVVTRDVPPFAVVAGVPARVVRMLNPLKFVTPHALENS